MTNTEIIQKAIDLVQDSIDITSKIEEYISKVKIAHINKGDVALAINEMYQYMLKHKQHIPMYSVSDITQEDIADCIADPTWIFHTMQFGNVDLEDVIEDIDSVNCALETLVDFLDNRNLEQ